MTTTTTARRLQPEDRKLAILDAAYSLAVADGYHTLTRERMAESAGVSLSLITYHWLSVALLREAVMQLAVERGDAHIIASGIVARDPLALSAPLALRQAAAATLAL